MRRLILVDLDGTLVNGNTFHVWIRFMLTKGWSLIGLGLMASLWIRVVGLSILRKLNLLSHADFKFGVQRAWGLAAGRDSAKILANYFIPSLLKNINKNVMGELKLLQNEHVVLATAAPMEYSTLLAESLGLFKACIATPRFDDEEWFDNIREEKRKSVCTYLEGAGESFGEVMLFTDHIDDLPLMTICDEIVLLPPVVRDIDFLSHDYSDKLFRRVG